MISKNLIKKNSYNPNKYIRVSVWMVTSAFENFLLIISENDIWKWSIPFLIRTQLASNCSSRWSFSLSRDVPPTLCVVIHHQVIRSISSHLENPDIKSRRERVPTRRPGQTQKPTQKLCLTKPNTRFQPEIWNMKHENLSLYLSFGVRNLLNPDNPAFISFCVCAEP